MRRNRVTFFLAQRLQRLGSLFLAACESMALVQAIVHGPTRELPELSSTINWSDNKT